MLNPIQILERVEIYLGTVCEDRNYETMCMSFELVDAARADVHNSIETPNFPSQVTRVLKMFDNVH